MRINIYLGMNYLKLFKVIPSKGFSRWYTLAYLYGAPGMNVKKSFIKFFGKKDPGMKMSH